MVLIIRCLFQLLERGLVELAGVGILLIEAVPFTNNKSNALAILSEEETTSSRKINFV